MKNLFLERKALPKEIRNEAWREENISHWKQWFCR